MFDQQDEITGYNLQLQLVKKITNPPKKILSTFDFINCAAGYFPETESLFIHNNIFKYHNVKELEILDPWMLNSITEETKENVLVQLGRFRKYCDRWDYTLGVNAFWKLIEVYEKYPHLKSDRGILVNTDGTAYSGVRYMINTNENIWSIIAPILRIHPEYKKFKDKYGHIDSKESIDTELTIREESLVNRQDENLENETILF